jgi:hypothetical protein
MQSSPFEDRQARHDSPSDDSNTGQEHFMPQDLAIRAITSNSDDSSDEDYVDDTAIASQQTTRRSGLRQRARSFQQQPKERNQKRLLSFGAVKIYGRKFRKVIIHRIFLDERQEVFVSASVPDRNGFRGAFFLPYRAFDRTARKEILARKPVAAPGTGEVVAFDDDGTLLWEILEVLDYNRNSDMVLVSWGGTLEASREWIPRNDLAPPHNSIARIENELGYETPDELGNNEYDNKNNSTDSDKNED